MKSLKKIIEEYKNLRADYESLREDIVNLETNHTLYHPVESYTNQTTKTLKK